ncbi:MAG: MarR family winged helix-turn-helix transcriptional regulator [Myxococcota bacterium]
MTESYIQTPRRRGHCLFVIRSYNYSVSSDTYRTNLLGAFATTIATRIDEQVAGVGVRGINAATALVTIRNHPNDSIEVLRRALGLTHSGAVRLINGLEDDGLVERHRSRDDGRSVVLRLTQQGRARADRVLGARTSVTNKVFDALSTEQRDALAPIMEAALEALTQSKDGARRICRLCDEQVCRPQGCPVEIAAMSCSATPSAPTASTQAPARPPLSRARQGRRRR